MTSYVLCTYFSVESLKFAVSSQHKMFPLVKQNFNSEKLQTGKKKEVVIKYLINVNFSLGYNRFSSRVPLKY